MLLLAPLLTLQVEVGVLMFRLPVGLFPHETTEVEVIAGL